MKWMIRMFLKLERRWHAVDLRLAIERGDLEFAADCNSRIDECSRKLAILRINE